MHNIEKIVSVAKLARASDIHIVSGIPVRLRIDGELTDMDNIPLTQSDCKALCGELAGAYVDRTGVTGETDFALTVAGIRCRINIFSQQGCYSAAVRLLNETIPKLSSLGLPEAVSGFAGIRNGLVLITGETGSGKTTTLAAILDEINRTRRVHILTLEDPIEYIYKPELAVINQREIGKDTASFSDGLRAALREDPDIILVGEMRDNDTIATALTAAETGQLVFGTLHTRNAADAIDRIVDSFPEGSRHQIRLQLSMSLKAVLSQQLVRKSVGGGRVAACEVMIVTPAIRNLIRENKAPQIQNSIQTSVKDGSILMDMSLARLVRSRTISQETALRASYDTEMLEKYISYN